MSATGAGHPDADSLSAYAVGKLDGAALASIHEHLEGCDACRRAVAVVPDDTLASLVRASATPPDFTCALPPEPDPPANGSSPSGPPAGAPSAVPPDLDGHPRYRVLEALGQG